MTAILAIDPSIVSLGWAYLKYNSEKRIWDLQSGTLRFPEAEKEWILEARLESCLKHLAEELDTHLGAAWFEEKTHIIIERPEQWGSFKTVVSQHSGALMLLYLFVGALFHWALTFTTEVKMPRVSEHKGQLPKEVTQKRMEEKYGRKFHGAGMDEADAVWIANWYQEKYLK